MKFLFIAESLHYRDWIGKTYADLLIYYKNNSKHHVVIIYHDQLIPFMMQKISRSKPDIIVFFDTGVIHFNENLTLLNKYFFNLNIPIFASLLDLYPFHNCINCPLIQKCAGLLHFGHASNLLSSYKEHFPNKIIKSFKGRFVNSTRFKRYPNYTKQYDILIYGSRGGIIHNGIPTANKPIGPKIEKHNADIKYKLEWEQHNKKNFTRKLVNLSSSSKNRRTAY